MTTLPAGVTLKGAVQPGFEQILTPEAIAFVVELERRFGARRLELLAAREARQARLDRGEKPDFLAETADVRAGDWTIAPLPQDLQDRRVEITGPVDRKMIINALNSGARLFMADFEDSNTPTWANQIEGQINLRDAVRRTIEFTDPASGKHYRLNEKPAVLKVRPRGWHLEERHLLVDGRPISGGLFDFGLFFFHNAKELLARGSGPYFYLPKMEGHLEARLWNDAFTYAEQALGVPHGSIKATVLIETILAAFEMDEILYELRDHSAGLNCGRWDYIFSFIKKFRTDPGAVLPDRAEVTMATHMMNSYSLLAIKTCHRRNAPAIGGMAAFIPIKGDEEANRAAFAKVKADKEREASNGHDGTWVAHPGLVPVALEVFDRLMPGPNQIARQRDDVTVTAADLLRVPDGHKTEAGLRMNVSVSIGYLEAWLRGLGCVPLFNLMEDAATAEISRTQIWQWLHNGSALDDGRRVDRAMVETVIAEELAAWKERVGADRYAAGKYEDAGRMLADLVFTDRFVEFLTLPAYERIVAEGA
ncbi:malate synthase A [Rhodospirillum centenum]|uniref:Malate synthase n=1 Tax=Rhodospirillum centenum (strain ATCC 51521 / SW) TaxID=414684 RepID=B6IUY1_RHOCS|nr:malate synthase A [Rhodospirillum centenum]ACJ00063.1 malate synthase A [Rhodospirillum centenum SW]